MLTCYHEVGHAVVAWLGGATVTAISVEGDSRANGYTRITNLFEPIIASLQLAPALRVKIGLAGWAAENRYRYGGPSAYELDRRLAWASWEMDGWIVADGLRALGGDKWATGYRLLDQVNSELQAYWPVVKQIAGALQRKRILEKGDPDMETLRKAPPIKGRPLTTYELNTRAATAEQSGNPELATLLRSAVARMENRQKPQAKRERAVKD